MFSPKREGHAGSPIKPAMAPAKVLALGFMLIILMGALLLMLPFSSRSGIGIGFLEALFTATSATCVTGLTVVDTYTAYTVFGQMVILSLIQVGGLGFMLFATTTLVALGRRITLRNRMLLRETMSLPGLSGGVRTTLQFMLIVFAVELAGAALLSIRFVPMYGWAKGVYFGVFHAVSAFCNAGFDLFGAAGSLIQFHGDPLVLLTISVLIVLGGIGFMVIAEVVASRGHLHRIGLHAKLVLTMTGLLLVSGFALYVAMEWNNPATLALPGAGPGEKVLNAWFQSVTTRTAGFFSFQQGEMTDTSKFVSVVLMFIGASPASTGGGVKTSTFMVVLLVIASIVAGREDINIFRKRVPAASGRTAQSILFMYLALLALGAVLLTIFENGKGFGFLDMLFEETSALGTVGLSTVGTAKFSIPSKVLLIVLMYFGRVGPLTMMLTLNHGNPRTGKAIRYPEEQIIIG